jgi:hypothetical protein
MKLNEPTPIQSGALNQSNLAARAYTHASLGAISAIERVNEITPTVSSVASSRREQITTLLVDTLQQVRASITPTRGHGSEPSATSIHAGAEQRSAQAFPDSLLVSSVSLGELSERAERGSANRNDIAQMSMDHSKKLSDQLRADVAELAGVVDNRTLFRALMSTPKWSAATASERQSLVNLLASELRAVLVEEAATSQVTRGTTAPTEIVDGSDAIFSAIVAQLFAEMLRRGAFSAPVGQVAHDMQSEQPDSPDDTDNALPIKQPNLGTPLPPEGSQHRQQMALLQGAQSNLVDGELIGQTAAWRLASEPQKQALLAHLSTKLFSDGEQSQRFIRTMKSKIKIADSLFDSPESSSSTTLVDDDSIYQPAQNRIDRTAPRTPPAKQSSHVDSVDDKQEPQAHNGGTIGSSSTQPLRQIAPVTADESRYRIGPNLPISVTCDTCGSIFHSRLSIGDEVRNLARLNRGPYRLLCERCASGSNMRAVIDQH